MEQKDEIEITMLDNGEGGDMARDIKAGLLSDPKDLSRWPKYLYDDEGSRLFEEITALPEYYQTRTELSILEARSEEIVARSDCREIVELGSGSSSKTTTLIEAMLDASGDSAARYSPLDVSESILRESGKRLNAAYPDLEIHGFVGDFGGSLENVLAGDTDGVGNRLVVFLGGTLGNFVPEERTVFLREIKDALSPGDCLLVGMDLVKDAVVLEAAYDDAAGVTARFNKNILCVLNDCLGAKFDPDLFEHRVLFDEETRRIEMWLDSQREQTIPVADLGLEVAFEEGEGMRTEMSYKFTGESAREALAAAGLDLLELYTDERDLFGLALAGK